jgi:spermidine/putrescine transport system permease protein
MKRPGITLWSTSLLLYLFLWAPIVVVMVYSFNAARYGGPWAGFSVEWYGRLFDSEEKIAAAWNTLVLALASTAIATVLGTLLGYGLSRYRFPGKRLFSTLMYIPVVLPDIVMAVALVLIFALMREALGLFQLGMLTMIVAHVTFQIPFVAVVVRARLVGADPAIEEAAHDLGASSTQAFMHVTLPMMLPAVIAGAMLAFTLSLDDFVISFFTTGPGATTLPILIYASVKRGITPDINALSTLIVLATIVATLAGLLFDRPASGGQAPRA